MKIRIRNALNFVKYLDDYIEAQIDISFSEVIKIIQSKVKFDIKEVKFFIVHGEKFIKIHDFSKKLHDYGFGSQDSILIEKNRKFEIDSYLVTVLSYIGPPFLFTIFSLISENLDSIKIISVLLIYFHFFRRIWESVFIFKYGREKIAIKDLLGVGLYYWILNGVCIGYSIFYTNDGRKTNQNEYLSFALILMFICCEINNSRCHIYLAELKENNNGQRAIPQGGMFNYVSCAHYLWELLSWFFFALIFNSLNCYLFVFYSFASMGTLAYQRHNNLKKYFGEKYPKNRKAFIPFIL
jgi:very-long-chain enoyl-CoA reductase